MRLSFLTPLKITLRRLLHRPVFSVVAVTMIALAVGATTAVCSVANAILLRPLPFSGPDRID